MHLSSKPCIFGGHFAHTLHCLPRVWCFYEVLTRPILHTYGITYSHGIHILYKAPEVQIRDPVSDSCFHFIRIAVVGRYS